MNLRVDPIGTGKDGKPVFLKDIWPDRNEIAQFVIKYVTSQKFAKAYGDVFTGDKNWQGTKAPAGATYTWPESTYIKQPPFFDRTLIEEAKVTKIENARILGNFGDFITTDHISPAGNISKSTPAAEYLIKHGVKQEDFNSYGARRGNHEVMIRGTFANVRIRNKMVNREGGFTKVCPEGKETTIFEASEIYRQRGIPLVVFGGKEYGSGSSRDWAAKGTRLLGVRAVIAESFERIHRSNLVGMGVIPIQFVNEMKADSLGLVGDEEVDILGLDKLSPKCMVDIVIKKAGQSRKIQAMVRIDTPNELKYLRSGGILPFVLERLAGA
jgi:aconitate hydratase